MKIIARLTDSGCVLQWLIAEIKTWELKTFNDFHVQQGHVYAQR